MCSNGTDMNGRLVGDRFEAKCFAGSFREQDFHSSNVLCHGKPDHKFDSGAQNWRFVLFSDCTANICK